MDKNIGKSVGAIMRNEKGEYLVLYRLKEPKGLALPAGHVDDGESPQQAIRREFSEETGMSVIETKEVYRGSFQSLGANCHDSHEWWVYEVIASGIPKLMEPTKHKFLCFMSLEEMRSYVEKGELDSAWFKYILPELGII